MSSSSPLSAPCHLEPTSQTVVAGGTLTQRVAILAWGSVPSRCPSDPWESQTSCQALGETLPQGHPFSPAFSCQYIFPRQKQTQTDSSTAAQADVQPGNVMLAIPRAHPHLSLDSEEGGGILSLPQGGIFSPGALLSLKLTLRIPTVSSSSAFSSQTQDRRRVDGIGASSATSIAENWLGALFRNRVSLRRFVSPVSLSSHSKTTERSHSTSNIR